MIERTMSDLNWTVGEGLLCNRWCVALRASLAEHRFYFAYVTVYLIFGGFLLIGFGSTHIDIFIANVIATIAGHLVFFLLLVLIWAYREIVRTQVEGFVPHLMKVARQQHLNLNALSRTLPILISIPLMFGIFFCLKADIGTIKSYQYDELFARWSIWISGGEPAWKALDGWFGRQWEIIVLNIVYYVWFPIVHITFYWQVMSTQRPALRLQYITAFVACWGVLGTVIAVAFPAAGPAFVGLITGHATPYDGLLNHLQGIQNSGYDLAALDVQSKLWNSYITKSYLPFSGMSAMPSLHVSMAVLMVLLGWKISRSVGMIYSLFAVLIGIGSVMLAFHYAADGLVASALTILIWVASGKVARLVHPKGD